MGTIMKYIESLTDHSIETKTKYNFTLININNKLDLKKSTEEQLWDHIESLDTKLQTKRNKQYVVKGYREFCKLDTSYFLKKLKKSNTGEYLNSETPVPTDKVVKKLPDNYKELINKIENPNYKLLLRLITDYNEILRTDLGFVKIADITEDTIVIKESRKTKMVVNIKLKTEDLKLINYSNEYLIDIKTKDRSNGYSKLVQRLTKLYLGIQLSQTDLRHLKATELHKQVEHLPIKEQQTILKEQASKRAHSKNTALEHYIDNTEDINVSINHKKTINILKDGKVIETYDILEIMRAMRNIKVIKQLVLDTTGL